MTVLNPPDWLQNAGATHAASVMRSTVGALSGPAFSAASLIPKGGVHPDLGNKLQVTQTGAPSLAVIVKSGVAWIPGTESPTQGAYGVINDADVTLSLTTAHATLPRIDRIVFKVEDSQYSGSNNTSSLAVVTGTPAGSPAAPSTPANAISLATVMVVALDTTIVNADITDTRTYMPTTTGGRYLQTVHYTSSATFTKSDYPYIYGVIVEIQGGGGGGGGAATTAASEAAVGAGGGGGGYSKKWIPAASLAATTSVTVGAAGSAASAGANTGGTGGTTSFAAHCTAAGGVGGEGGTASAATNQITAGGAGGVGASGDLNIPGGYGINGIRGSGIVACQGVGGTSHFAGNRAGNAADSTGTGQAGQLYGGGGSGGHNQPSQTQVGGGAGGAGLVMVHVFVA
jgi:hypothetical protein